MIPLLLISHWPDLVTWLYLAAKKAGYCSPQMSGHNPRNSITKRREEWILEGKQQLPQQMAGGQGQDGQPKTGAYENHL